ncbi:bifunctional folylpolyglutamate synthase/dihydrofolate synthase [Marinilongibacter aquaticus]|uniref:bifunctional folylpolyglutamate synthase/dihydrofolate synthase n=1 Tax=Marinilongibacter aquaticus TaxID=2975157 RepID=UPI0021BD5786|nr:folylpolyglutamate synthase/dihydrofolate synthase family protein [Marinilongibacter aquaticus]UBM59462.1 bifunctional folylpolyglutamate synthase/dihydrofolate synthase [Marinilongibacter aquaticus]
MTYQETLDFLYDRLPAFQKQGNAAIKVDLKNIKALAEHLGHPEKQFKSIHVAGTNGKGSSSHMLASILQESGLKTGLYTSPHLKDFRERFRTNGEMPSEQFVIDFVQQNAALFESIQPSFFEVTVAMAFSWFAEEKVDVAVIEVGLGGRLDSTNIILPELSLITNIGYDHTEILGEELAQIAFEKAGIIKHGVPVVISEYHEETAPVFQRQAAEKEAEIYFARDLVNIQRESEELSMTKYLVSVNSGQKSWTQMADLMGNYQENNIRGVIAAIQILQKQKHWNISDKALQKGIANTVSNTKLKGRWQILSHSPLVVADTGHNAEAFVYLKQRLLKYAEGQLHFILAFTKDKTWREILGTLPKGANYYFANYNSPRSEATEIILEFAKNNSIKNVALFADVNEALAVAKTRAREEDFIYVGGSTYFVAEINDL